MPGRHASSVTLGGILQHGQERGKLALIQPDASSNVQITQPVNMVDVDIPGTRHSQQPLALPF
jgi:hypothetical protein